MRDLPIYFLVEVWLLFVEVDSVVDVSDMIVCVVSLVVLGGDEDVCSAFSGVVIGDVFVVPSDVVVVGNVFVVLSDVVLVDDVFVVLSDVESTLNVLVVVSAGTVILLNVEFSLEPISSKRLSTESV